MHGEDLIVAVRAEQARFRAGELDPHQRGEDSAKRKKPERREDVALADDFVIDA